MIQASYQIQVTVSDPEGPEQWRGSVQVPTFYLAADVQGIQSMDHAAKIAADVCDPTQGSRLYVHVEDADGNTLSTVYESGAVLPRTANTPREKATR